MCMLRIRYVVKNRSSELKHDVREATMNTKHRVMSVSWVQDEPVEVIRSPAQLRL
jgi:hypothetical protein